MPRGGAYVLLHFFVRGSEIVPRETTYFDERQIKQIATMSGLGMSVEQMALILGVSKATFDRRKNDQEGVSEAVEKGRASASLLLRQTAYDMATSGKHPVMTIFLLKVREGWKEPRDVDPNDAFKDKSIGELIELVRALLPKEETPK